MSTDIKPISSLYPFQELKKVGDKITLDENDNIPSIRAMVSMFKKSNPKLEWTIKVVKDYFTDNYMILRTK